MGAAESLKTEQANLGGKLEILPESDRASDGVIRGGPEQRMLGVQWGRIQIFFSPAIHGTEVIMVDVYSCRANTLSSYLPIMTQA